MGAHYLVDLHAAPVSSAGIHDVRYPTNGQSTLNGHFVVRVPDGVAVKKPTGVSDLITKKYQGLLAFYAGFTRVTFDDLLDTTSIDLTYAGTSGVFGDRNQVALNPGGSMQSTVITLIGGAPSQAVITWEVFEVVDVDPSADRLVRTYSELASSTTYSTVQVSFDGGSTFLPTSDGAILNIPALSQGTDFIFRITNPHASKRVRVGSWSVIY